MTREIHGETVFGVDVDAETRCAHWHSELDIIAIKFKCCGKYYPCFECHTAEADHKAEVWPVDEFEAEAILCGGCGKRLRIAEYMSSGSKCPACLRQFNPGCENHYDLYFTV
ncbi:MAG TPA: CHY zinc finger protein [Pyrinomonadaceae bacterium]|nr:CHY zinc finger protein [Pyrinomonadaceae bacterium]